MDVSQLEPADRDPAKLRATAWKIVAFMVASAVILTYAYSRYAERTSDSERPSMLTKITEPDVELLTADGELRNLQDLQGNVTLALILPKDPPEESQPSLEALERVMNHFQEAEKKPQILVFVLDGSNSSPEEMSSVLSQYGAEPEVLRVVADQDGKSSLRSFTKTKMRFGIVPTGKDGEFNYDTSLILLDQHLHVRGHPGRPFVWDFEKVENDQAAFAEAKATRPEEELQAPLYTTEELQDLLIQSIQYLYDNPNEKAQK